jgi:formylmethanofuran dehydrogenase subunit E
MRWLAQRRAVDEELVAVVENDACGVDAVQFLAGCTFGKGNLIFRDHGKQVYTFYARSSGAGVRVTTADGEGMRTRGGTDPADRDCFVAWLLAAPEEEVLSAREATEALPSPARIRRSVTCAFCGERVMETRARVREGQTACIPCTEGG